MENRAYKSVVSPLHGEGAVAADTFLFGIGMRVKASAAHVTIV